LTYRDWRLAHRTIGILYILLEPLHEALIMKDVFASSMPYGVFILEIIQAYTAS